MPGTSVCLMTVFDDILAKTALRLGPEQGHCAKTEILLDRLV